MTDIYDQATEREERDRAAAIAAARVPVQALPEPTGVCLNCTEELWRDEAVAARWCCAECRDDWQVRAVRRGR